MAVRVRDVRRRYDDTLALDGVSFSIESGEVFALIGPNGAGKTTLVRAVTGTTDAEGTVELFGESPIALDPHRLGLLPQEFSPAARLTARELLAYYAGLYDESRGVERVLDDVGLSDRADTYYENLSGGQKRRLCVGVALVNDPDLLVLDEPTTGIDPAGRRDLWTLVETLAAGGTTVLLTTHYMEEAQRLADRVGLLSDGELIAIGSPAELVSAYGDRPRLLVETPTPGKANEAISAAGYDLLEDRHPVSVAVEPREIGAVADTLETAGIEYESLVWRQPDLEDVYLSVTGGTANERGTVESSRLEGGSP